MPSKYFETGDDKNDFNDEEKLLEAIRHGNIKVIKQHIQNGFKIERKIGIWPMLMHACSAGHPKLLEYLMSEGANPKMSFGQYTPLMALCCSPTAYEDDLLKCFELLKDKIEINSKNEFGLTALMFAAKENRLKLVDKLINNQCDINLQDLDGNSALFHAILKNRKEVVEQLLAAGAKLDLLDTEGRTAYDLACNCGYVDLAKLVRTKDDEELEEDFDLTEPINLLFKELPFENGNMDYSGFPSEVEVLLLGMNMNSLKEKFKNNNIQLGEFLTISNQRLKEIGVQFTVHRHHILYCIQKFHLRLWDKRSLNYKETNVPITFEDSIPLLLTIVKHLHVLKATTQYIRSHLNKPVDSEIYDNVSKGLAHLINVNSEISRMQMFGKNLEKIESLKPADLIQGNGSVTKYKPLIILGLFIFSTIAFKFKKDSNIINTFFKYIKLM
uniref:SAM domain-containing protein n=1 Tax=Clastoptera arizonana TaxID=38151 RepID=A0A1B6CTH6_9HEMI